MALLRLLGRGLRISVDVVDCPTVPVEIGGVTFEVRDQVAQAIAAERKVHAAEVARIASTAAAAIEAGRAAEKTAIERAEVAEERAKLLEAELAAAHACAASVREEASRAAGARDANAAWLTSVRPVGRA